MTRINEAYQYFIFSLIEPNISVSRYAAFLYTQILRILPAIVRKWCNGANPKQAQIIEKITGNYVTPMICQQELLALLNKSEESDNLDVSI